jgi:alpha-methylacyl-CoA racemase
VTGWGQCGPLAPRAGHDINYIAISGALHAIGAAGQPPTVPLNLVADYGGGTMFAIAGMLAALLSAKNTGVGQVVDVAMTDGVASLLSLFHAFKASGVWQDRPGANLLDGAAPFYRCYRCADGRHVAVGALEPQFFAQLIEGLEIDPNRYTQYDTTHWLRMAEDFTAAFATRSRDEWAALFEERDACVSPVLSLTEATTHPHNIFRETYIKRAGFSQPAPAPRFSLTRGVPSDPVERSLADQVTHWQRSGMA